MDYQYINLYDTQYIGNSIAAEEAFNVRSDTSDVDFNVRSGAFDGDLRAIASKVNNFNITTISSDLPAATVAQPKRIWR